MLCAYASHGDTRHICLYPADPREAFEMAVKAFDLAERFQTPVFVLSDLDIGMNDWMVPKLTWDDAYRPDRGKVLSAAELEQAKSFYRYLDVDGDGIPQRIAAGRASQGRLLHARLGPQQVRRLHRGRRRVPGSARPRRPQDPERRQGGAGAGRPQARRARRWGSSPSAAATPRAWRRWTCWPRTASPLDYMRVRGFPFGDDVRAVPRRRTTSTSSSSRTATRSCAAC